MGKVTFATVIYERFKNKNGKYPVKLRVTYNKVPTYFATNLFADPTDLAINSKEKNIPIKNNVLKRKVQQLVQDYEDAAESFDSSLFPEWTVNEVMQYLQRVIVKKNGFKLNFVEFCNNFIKRKATTTSKGSADNYRRAIKLLCQYLGKDEFDISLITSSLMRNWEQQLRYDYGDTARTVSMMTSHIATMHRTACKQFNSEEMDELNIRKTFDYYTPPRQPSSEHRDIDPEVIQKMINTYNSLDGQERLAIGVYLLSFSLMGMNTPDLYECLAPKNRILSYNRHKTRARRSDKAEMMVKIPECILQLYEEYKDVSGKYAFNFNSRYCRYSNMQDAEIKGMKKFKHRIGYKGKLTNYSARHTWATIARGNKCKISSDLISDCLNHVGVNRVVDIYAKKDFTVLWDVNEKVLGTLDWSPLQSK